MRLSRLICCLLLFVAVARAEPVATLVTVGPGDAVWEKFGHNMIRLQDEDRGFDVCYNWGLFDFDKPNFIGNFVQGRMLYTMAALRTRPLLDDYQAQNRRVTFQKLNLSPDELRELIVRCETNRRPENADYRYDYFKDNCSTRVRDTLDAATGGKIAALTRGTPTRPPVTYRHEALRLMRDDFWVSLGVDFALGPNTDKPLDRWQECFLPAAVSDAAGECGLADAPAELWPTTRPPPSTTPPVRWPGLFAAGLAIAAIVLAVGRYDRDSRARAEALGGVAGVRKLSRSEAWRLAAARTACVSPVVLWWLVSGFGGWFVVYVWTLTDHVAGYANQNLWQFSPLAWVALGLAMIRRRRAAWRVAVVIAALSLVGAGVWAAGRLGGPYAQPNGGFVLLALPINLAVARAMRPALTKRPAVDDMAGPWPTAPQSSPPSP